MCTTRSLPAMLAALALLGAGTAAVADSSPPVTSPDPASSFAPDAPPVQQPAPVSSQAGQGLKGIDPCALLAQPDVASALGVGIDQLRAPTRPTTTECLWAAAAHGSDPTRQVLLAIDQGTKSGCRGLQCLAIVQTVTSYIPGMSAFNQAIGSAENVVYITGLGDKAAWKDGWLTVLKQAVVFRLEVSGSQSSTGALPVSETLARAVLAHL
jgi:hypothetical protein